MVQNNEPCSLCNQCDDIKAAIRQKLISIADARLYNIRFELGRPVAYGLYRALRYYRQAIDDICSGETCNFCYGGNIENVLERARIISA